jgi:cytochrome P450
MRCTYEQKLASVDIVIPEGTEVLLPFYLLSRNVEEWGAPIDTFNPDRFLTDGPNGTLAQRGGLV